MLSDSNGKLLVYTSTSALRARRLKPVSLAVEKMAKVLKANVEVVTFRKRFIPIYVYYKDGEEEPIPIYCNNDGEPDLHDVCTALKNMMFVLSFHPRHTSLRQMRKEIMQFS